MKQTTLSRRRSPSASLGVSLGASSLAALAILSGALGLQAARDAPRPATAPTPTAAIADVAAVRAPAPSAFANARVAVYFSPRGGAQAAIIREIDAARSSVLVQAYSFTSVPISQALVRALGRGVSVRVVLDKSQGAGLAPIATALGQSGAEVRLDTRHAIAHSKIMLLDTDTDAATIVSGSFNFTKAAEERNSENLLVLKRCPSLVASYRANWNAHAAHAEPYAPSAK